MKKYKFHFRGRQSGAIGIFYEISETYKADSLSEAKSLLYEDYEHIGQLSVKCNGKEIDREEFDNAPFIKVRPNRERQRAANGGSYLHTRSDTPIK